MQNHYDSSSVSWSCRSWSGVQRTIWYGKSLAPSRYDKAAAVIVLLCMHRLHITFVKDMYQLIGHWIKCKILCIPGQHAVQPFPALARSVYVHISKHFTAVVIVCSPTRIPGSLKCIQHKWTTTGTSLSSFSVLVQPHSVLWVWPCHARQC